MTTQEEINQLNEVIGRMNATISEANTSIQKATLAKESLEAKLRQEQEAKREPEGNEFFAIPNGGSTTTLASQSITSGKYYPWNMKVYHDEAWTPCPTTEQYAEAYAEAHNIWKEWNACKGVQAASDTELQWFVDCDLDVCDYCSQTIKASRLSPCFDTAENAKASIEKVGAERIKRMWRLFHFDLTALSEED